MVSERKDDMPAQPELAPGGTIPRSTYMAARKDLQVEGTKQPTSCQITARVEEKKARKRHHPTRPLVTESQLAREHHLHITTVARARKRVEATTGAFPREGKYLLLDDAAQQAILAAVRTRAFVAGKRAELIEPLRAHMSDERWAKLDAKFMDHVRRRVNVGGWGPLSPPGLGLDEDTFADWLRAALDGE